MKNNKDLRTLMGMIILSSSICAASQCPHNDEVTHNIEALANAGKATFQNGTYHLIGKDKTSIFYTEQLLQNDVQLNGFLKVSKLLDKNLPNPEAHLIDLLPTPNFCTYKISMGDTHHVIALSSTP